MQAEEINKIPSGFKLSEIGLIPSDWEVNNIFNISTLKARIGWQGLTTAEYLETGEYCLITGTDFKSGKINWDNCYYVSKERYIQDKFIQIKVEDILITKDGTIGKVAFINKLPLQSTLNSGVFVIRPRNKKYVPLFLYYLFNSMYFSDFLNKLIAGSTINHLYQKDFVTFNIPLPSTKSEQTAIATALSDADALITSLEKLIAKKRDIKKGAMQELLKPKEGWEVKTLGEVGNTYGGLSGKSKEDFQEGNYKYIPFMNIMSNPIIDINYFDSVNIGKNENQNKALKGDLFFNGSSETPEEVGMCSILQDDIDNLYLNSFCFGFRIYKDVRADGLFLSYLFRSSEGRKLFYSLAQGATRYNLSKSNFLKMEIPFPSYEEQQVISKIFNDIDLEINVLKNKLSKQKDIKQGMMQNLLTGKIRLV